MVIVSGRKGEGEDLLGRNAGTFGGDLGLYIGQNVMDIHLRFFSFH